MALFRSKPVVVDAEQWFPGNGCRGVRDDHPAEETSRKICGCVLVGDSHSGVPHVHPSPLSSVRVNPGDWVIREPDCKPDGPQFFYPCRDEVFREKYEPHTPG